MQAEDRGSGLFVAALFLAALGLVVTPLALIGVIAAVRDKGSAVSQSTVTTAKIALKEFSITGDLSVPAGDITLAAANVGSQTHNLVLKGGKGTKDILPGGSDTLAVGRLEPGSYTLTCTIAGHEAAGMVTTLQVTAGDSRSAGDSGGHGDGSGPIDYAKLDKAMNDSLLAFPAKTKGQGNEELKPRILADGTKEFSLTTEIVDWEVAPGQMVKAWAYNGMVPGPLIRTNVGDKVRMVVTNKLPMGTEVHVHGVKMPFEMDGVAPITQKIIEPGKTFVYEFSTPELAVAMYHAHNHGQMQVTNGLFGTFLVGQLPLPTGRTIGGIAVPKDIKISQEIPMVLNDAGVIGLTLNGKSFPATQPYVGKVGDWVQVHYFNEGLQIHPMHQHRFPQLVIAKDGIPLDSPYWVDTLNVAPGERYTVIYNLDLKGIWVWHCHILSHVERDEGAFGMLTAFIVE